MLNFGNKEFRNLQEQVLKNAQDIEILKGRKNLRIAIVNELPEVGDPNYIYLVAKDGGESPDVYDEYVWLDDVDPARYEKIGGVTIDLTNYVTLDSEQTIAGVKTISDKIRFQYPEQTAYYDFVASDYGSLTLKRNGTTQAEVGNNEIYVKNLKPTNNNVYDLGSASIAWKDLYLSGKAIFGNSGGNDVVWKFDSGFLSAAFGSSNAFMISSTTAYARAIVPVITNYYDLGSASNYWKDFYLTGNISDGSHTVSVANIASKATSTFISGTFDANGETTIDTEQEGTPEGLFIFTYGNCQCFLRLTATMVQNADTAPIRIACPMIYNSDTVNGWLNITRAGYILILTITDGTNHVDSGYAWTLTKTNLI